MVDMSTREHLTDLGEQAIRMHGYGGFSYADLARDAGIRKASIHHHFPAKADLGLAVLERYAERLEARLEEIGAQSACAGAALRSAVDLYRDALGEGNSRCLCAALAGDGKQSSPAIMKRLAAANAMVTSWFRGVLADGQKDGTIAAVEAPDREAAAMLAQLQGAQLLARAGSDLSLFDRAVATLLSRIVRD